ncbi:MAG: HlyD family efflux transporter periplasmic adaptor subunit [Eubacteriales bacterium]|nr:HlyD family efflux transporter periplasmic adaptor subunit [Eubacteriales bacterium]MDD4582627.1 HlyD family efflux transporter periplasmic adaptor subunit [Eubacteriales bacterium]
MWNNKKRNPKKILAYLFALAILVLFLIIYVFPMVTGALTQTSLVEYGSIQILDEANCYFVREEKVVNAAASGAIQYYFEEGELVRKGTKVLDLVPAGGNYIVGDNSIISYYHDGLEEVFTPKTMSSLKKENIENLEISVKNIKRESAISGEPLYKIVDNSVWYVIFWVEPNRIVKYTKGNTVYLNLPLGQVKGTTYDIIDDQGKWLVILKFTRYYEDLPKLRNLKTEVVTSDYEGLMIANESITSYEGSPGVYVKDINGEYIFTPVSVITSDGNYSLVESSFYYKSVDGENVKVFTVDVYDEILNHPERK